MHTIAVPLALPQLSVHEFRISVGHPLQGNASAPLSTWTQVPAWHAWTSHVTSMYWTPVQHVLTSYSSWQPLGTMTSIAVPQLPTKLGATLVAQHVAASQAKLVPAPLQIAVTQIELHAVASGSQL